MMPRSSDPSWIRRHAPAPRPGRIHRPGAILAGAIAAVMILATACASGGSGSGTQASSAHGPITIGIIADMTGSTKTIGSQFINGSEAAAKVFGPINGRQVKFVTEDGGNFSASTA